jgi:hypothetical protein
MLCSRWMNSNVGWGQKLIALLLCKKETIAEGIREYIVSVWVPIAEKVCTGPMLTDELQKVLRPS